MAAITDLTTLTAIASGDYLVVNDVSAGSDKKITQADFLGGSGTWTPVLTFGGASTGITYGTQTGIYRRVGTLVWVACRITLTSKGSSTGGAIITGLPFSVATLDTPLLIMWTTLGASVTTLQALATGTTIVLYSTTGSTGLSSLLDTTFANTSTIWVSGSYATT